MKADIHPKYTADAKFTCSCGNVFTIGSTKENVSIEICSQCHPFYTGNEKVLDAAGRVEKFKARQASATAAAAAKKAAPAKEKTSNK
ncbi:MAG: 50S ribosomal protein L31 [bacterium]